MYINITSYNDLKALIDWIDYIARPKDIEMLQYVEKYALIEKMFVCLFINKQSKENELRGKSFIVVRIN